MTHSEIDVCGIVLYKISRYYYIVLPLQCDELLDSSSCVYSGTRH